MRKLIGLMVCAAALNACNRHETNLQYPQPADVFLDRVGSLAVLPLQGEAGRDVATRLSDSLATAEFYSVTNATQLEALGSDLYLGRRLAQLQAAEGADDEVGALLGNVDAVVTGRVTQFDVKQEIRKNLNLFGDPNHDTWYRHATCTVSVLVDVRAVPSGDSLYAREYTSTHTADGLSYPSRYLVPLLDWHTVENLRKSTIKQVGGGIADYMAPSLKSERFVLYSDKRVPGSEAATHAAEAGDWSKALELYAKGAQEASKGGPKKLALYRARAHYSHGVALLARWQLAEARAAFRRAYKEHADKEFSSAEARALGMEKSARCAVKQAEAIQRALDAR